MNDYNPFSLSGKTIFVTGASSGIGKSIAIECSKMGARLIITGRNAERLQQTSELLFGEGHSSFQADLSNEEIFEKVVERLPILDGVVHCAGIAEYVPVQFIKSSFIQKIMTTNFIAPTAISAQLVKAKKLKRGSSVVFISSISGVNICPPGGSVYAASKGAINGFIKGMALELASKGIRVNSVNPGMVETPLIESGEVSAEQLDEDRKRYPLKRYGKPEEVAYSVIYLLSDAASWVTGSALLIDGGYTLL